MEGSHEAIIEPAEWQIVQMEIQRRKNLGRSHSCCSPFSAKLKCGDCGEYFGSKVWHSNSKYKRTVWQCNAKFKGESKCATPHLYEQRIKELFLEAVGSLMEKREEIIGDCRAVMEMLADCSAIDTELESVRSERKSSMTFSADSLQNLARRRSCRWILMRSCFTGWWITLRSMRMAGGYSLFATAQKWKREYKTGSGRRYRNGTDAFGRFFCA